VTATAQLRVVSGQRREKRCRTLENAAPRWKTLHNAGKRFTTLENASQRFTTLENAAQRFTTLENAFPFALVVGLLVGCDTISLLTMEKLLDASQVLVAAEAGDSVQVLRLLDLQANVNTHRDGQTCVHFAIGHNQPALLQALIDRNAHLNARNLFGYTPLASAICNSGFGDLTRILLHARADVNAGTYNDVKPLHLAANAGSAALIDALLDLDADIDAADTFGARPLHYAVTSAHQQAVLRLLDRRANPNVLTSSTKSPLHLAAKNNLEDIATLLLDHKADINATDDANQTPLHIVTIAGYESVALCLLQYRPNVNITASGNYTALHYAAIANRTALAVALIDCGADKSIEIVCTHQIARRACTTLLGELAPDRRLTHLL
jgi:ankyrin repeat protein